MTARLPLAFFASGAAALLFQVLWFRALGRLLGNTVWAGTLVLTAFMLGMAIGGVLVARWAQRIRNPARAFALAEITVGVTGSLLVWGLPLLEAAAGQWLAPLAEHSTTVAGARLAIALGAMLVPTIAMGTTLALGVRALAQRNTARALGVLYAANTFGACLAPLAAEYYLIGELGLRGTALAAAGLNLLAATLAAAGTAPAAALAAPASAAQHLPRRLLLAAAGAGALALGLEVIWFRLLVLYAPGSDATFAIMLTVVLLGIAAGGALAPLLARLETVWIVMGSCLCVVLGYLLAGWAFGVQAGLGPRALLLMLPAALLSGSLFTLLGAELRADAQNPQPAIGILTTANTLGAALGAAIAGLVLLPLLGIEGSLFTLAAGYAALTLLVARPARLALPLAATVAGLALFPFGRIDIHLMAAALPYRMEDGSQVVQVTQGPNTTLQVLQRKSFGEPAAWRLVADSYSMTGVDPSSTRYMQMFAWLPLALHAEPRRALLISYGAGNTARALLSGPELERLTVVDVSTEFLGASPLIHGARDPLKDPRVRVVLEDGRHYLRMPGEQFDIITAEPPPPLIAGVVNLYTREYFQALAARLAPGGLATYWLPAPQFTPDGARATARAFCEAFPDCTLWAGNRRNWILMGGREFTHRPAEQHIARLWRDAQAGPLLAANGLESPRQLGAAFMADAKQLRTWYGDTPALIDDYPKRIAPETVDRPTPEDFTALLQPEGARRRFQDSPWIAAHWPAPLARASLPYFAVQPILNNEIHPDPVKNMAQVDAILRNTDLRIPVLWLLGSDATEQEIVNRRLAEGYLPEYAYLLGVRSLSERDYAKAAELFAASAKRWPRLASTLAAYSKCRAARPAAPCL